MKVHTRDARLQFAKILENMLNDWKKQGYISSLRSYCGNSYEFPYSQLRKMEHMQYIKPFSSARKNKTYEWVGGEVPSFEGLAQRVMNNIGRDDSKMYRTKFNDAPEEVNTSFGFARRGEATSLVSLGIGSEYQQKIQKQKDETTLAIRIAMILKEKGLSDDQIEQATKDILSLLG